MDFLGLKKKLPMVHSNFLKKMKIPFNQPVYLTAENAAKHSA